MINDVVYVLFDILNWNWCAWY